LSRLRTVSSRAPQGGVRALDVDDPPPVARIIQAPRRQTGEVRHEYMSSLVVPDEIGPVVAHSEDATAVPAWARRVKAHRFRRQPHEGTVPPKTPPTVEFPQATDDTLA